MKKTSCLGGAQAFFLIMYLGTIQVLRQQRGGWDQKMAFFADLQYY